MGSPYLTINRILGFTIFISAPRHLFFNVVHINKFEIRLIDFHVQLKVYECATWIQKWLKLIEIERRRQINKLIWKSRFVRLDLVALISPGYQMSSRTFK